MGNNTDIVIPESFKKQKEVVDKLKEEKLSAISEREYEMLKRVGFKVSNINDGYVHLDIRQGSENERVLTYKQCRELADVFNRIADIIKFG